MKINAFYRRKYVCKFLKLETHYTWFISIKQMFKILSREPVKIITIKINDNVESTNEKSTTRRKYKLKYKLRLQQPLSTRGFQRPRTFRVTKGNAPTRFFDPTHPINLPLPSISILAVYSIQCRVFIVPSREEERVRERKKSINRDISHLKQRGKLANVEMIQRLGRNVGHHQSNAIRRPINQWSNQSTVLLDRWNVVVASFNAARCWWISS